MLFRYLYVVLSNKRPQLFSDYLIKSFSCLESPYKVVATLVESKSFMKYCTYIFLSYIYVQHTFCNTILMSWPVSKLPCVEIFLTYLADTVIQYLNYCGVHLLPSPNMVFVKKILNNVCSSIMHLLKLFWLF